MPYVGAAVQGGSERRGIFPGHPVGGDSSGRARAAGGQGGGGGLRPEDVGHRRVGDLSGLAGEGTRAGGRHQHRVRQLHDGDAEAPEPRLAHPDRVCEYRRRRSAGRQRAARGGMQVCGGLAGDAQPARHLPEPARHVCTRSGSVHRAIWLRRSGARHGGRVHPLARKAQSESREDGDPRGDPAPARSPESSLVLQGAAHARGVS